MYRVEYISTFHADVLTVAEFLEEYPKKAARIFATIDNALRNLAKWPEMYPVYHDIPAFRFIVAEDYLVFYKVKNQEKLVEVHRLLHGRMDVPTHMQD